jgi:hypothetical protein
LSRAAAAAGAAFAGARFGAFFAPPAFALVCARAAGFFVAVFDFALDLFAFIFAIAVPPRSVRESFNLRSATVLRDGDESRNSFRVAARRAAADVAV